ncbi:glycosyltransferase family 2 protein [Mongoliitalea daihaiensis]|uniref:glycosyltransferase family 2 protein n=1 Tax=Mongoliitalea daihaiensis TaxID=2782006 RepID=UPI001F45AB12|nr:glycosyltransferase [Mongoliitalea daihaiensis]UJP63383.1 glycosyltransferase [Mongoliitalea daihaiensis]
MLVSIVSVFYNREDVVDFSVESLLKQTYENIEIILCDDGSSDNTYKKLKVYESLDDRVRVIHHPNIGFTNSILKAVDKAVGELIAIHGSGDYSYPERIQKQVNYLIENPSVGVVGCLFEREDLVLNRKVVVERSKSDDVLNNICVSHGEVMFRKDVYSAAGGYRPFFHFSQDRDLWLRMSLSCKLDFVPEVLYTAFTRNDGVTGNAYKRAIQLYFAEMAKQMYEMRKQIGWDFIDRFGNNAWVFMRKSKRLGKELMKHSLWAFRQGYTKEANRILSIAKDQSNTFSISLMSTTIFFLGRFENGPCYLSRILDFKRKLLK